MNKTKLSTDAKLKTKKTITKISNTISKKPKSFKGIGFKIWIVKDKVVYGE